MKKSPKLSSKAYAAKTSEKALYLINDEYNTFEHVINCLVTICEHNDCLLYTSPSPRDRTRSRMPSSA